MVCATGTEHDCNETTAVPLSYPFNNAQSKEPGPVSLIFCFLSSLFKFQNVEKYLFV